MENNTYYSKNTIKAISYQKQYYKNNKETIKIYQKQYYLKKTEGKTRRPKKIPTEFF